ncbi:TetR/AcrR family transcriptional regulator [Amycolatopsis sp. 195334CR]|uniref:TetR/AcrR family transcriptional regulator n=1 Tax=Amycolatopsis sp. 195334CR TaxID=2814588 RepID=UPI001A8FC119|nr:TetR/AcrR family transcriptional regulator [Amycolatopsis sp. 195334CR]MBN6039245.1 TetR/AcrR family transcriptional regulator [Amycolatopsis sp. 195334CR]
MDTRTSILVAAAELLAASPVSDVSTRAVCEAAGVGAPTLYRHFGDKEGLLSAVVDYGFEQYLAGKRAAKASADPVKDLRDGWDSHVAFAVRNPAFYRLMHSPAVTTPPDAAAEALRLLTEVLERCAAAGRLRVPPPIAAQMVMSANVGFALMLLTQPDSYDAATSTRVRDAIHAAILADAPVTANGPAAAATQLAALLPESTSDSLSAAETAVLREWLARLA